MNNENSDQISSGNEDQRRDPDRFGCHEPDRPPANGKHLFERRLHTERCDGACVPAPLRRGQQARVPTPDSNLAIRWLESAESWFPGTKAHGKANKFVRLSPGENECERTMMNAETPVFQGLLARLGSSGIVSERAFWLPGLDSNQRPFD